MKKRNPTEHQIFLKKRDALLPQIREFEKAHGSDLARSAMRKHLWLEAERERNQSQIRALEEKLDGLKAKGG